MGAAGGELRALVVPLAARVASDLRCGICGSLFRPRRVCLCVAGDGALFACVCPDCVLAGPAGAARRMRAFLGRRKEDTPPGRRRAVLSAWERRVRARLSLLEAASVFPLPARLAAARELREAR